MDRTYSGYPENYLIVPRGQEIDTDALSCVISRAQAVQHLIADYFERDTGNKYNDEIMAHACWALQGLLDQALILVEGKEK